MRRDRGFIRHIESASALPSFKRCLSLGAAAAVRLNGEMAARILAFEVEQKKFVIVSTPECQGVRERFFLIDALKSSGLAFNGYYTTSAEVCQWLGRQYLREDPDARLATEAAAQLEVENFQKFVKDSRYVDWLRTIVQDAVNLGATDIHFEVGSEQAYIRVRRDGVMRSIGMQPADFVKQVLSVCYNIVAHDGTRSEVAFNLTSPQSAMIPFDLGSRSVVLRYQSHPTVNGVDAVMRILKSDTDAANLPQIDLLGYTSDQIEMIVNALAASTGGIFVAGITGSGKTTTLSALLGRLVQDGARKIISIEDPVEYQIPGVSHFSIQRQASSIDPFAQALNAFLRMDPDVGMFGEVRDSVSAQAAFDAVQTGHKLLTTVHATSALGIIPRLCSSSVGLLREDLCGPGFLSLLMYQTLTPLTCPHCKLPAKDVMVMSDLDQFANYFGLDPENICCASDGGCAQCCPPSIITATTGIKKRLGIRGVKVNAEVIEPEPTLLELLYEGKDNEARKHWRGMQKAKFDEPSMRGKPAWAHGLLDVSRGVLDPYYFEQVHGKLSLLAKM